MKQMLIGLLVFSLVITAFCFIAPKHNYGLLGNAYAAVTTNLIESGAYTSVQNCVFGADSDTSCSLTFNFGQPNSSGVITNMPDSIILTPIANSSGSISNGAIFSPFVNSVSAGLVTINKPATTGSGGNVIRVTIQQFHSIIR